MDLESIDNGRLILDEQIRQLKEENDSTLRELLKNTRRKYRSRIRALKQEMNVTRNRLRRIRKACQTMRQECIRLKNDNKYLEERIKRELIIRHENICRGYRQYDYENVDNEINAHNILREIREYNNEERNC